MAKKKTKKKQPKQPNWADTAPFWEVALALKRKEDACADATGFIMKHKPASLNAVWERLLAGFDRAQASGREESAYAEAIASWTCWMLGALSKHDEGVQCPECSTVKCPHCKQDVSDDEVGIASVPRLSTWLADNDRKLPFTEAEVRDAVRDIRVDDDDNTLRELEEEDAELAK